VRVLRGRLTKRLIAAWHTKTHKTLTHSLTDIIGPLSPFFIDIYLLNVLVALLLLLLLLSCWVLVELRLLDCCCCWLLLVADFWFLLLAIWLSIVHVQQNCNKVNFSTRCILWSAAHSHTHTHTQAHTCCMHVHERKLQLLPLDGWILKQFFIHNFPLCGGGSMKKNSFRS